MNFDQIKQLIDIVCERDLGGLEIEETGFRLKIEGPVSVVSGAVAAAPIGAAGAPAVGPAAATPTVVAASSAATSATRAAASGHVITSPIVGTFYPAPSPDAEPYVRVGDSVSPGQVLCIVEAMKLMNEIESDIAGEVVEVFPKNSQPVEYGEPLFTIKPS